MYRYYDHFFSSGITTNDNNSATDSTTFKIERRVAITLLSLTILAVLGLGCATGTCVYVCIYLEGGCDKDDESEISSEPATREISLGSMTKLDTI